MSQVLTWMTDMTNMTQKGGLAQLARALALQARGHRFESDILHD